MKGLMLFLAITFGINNEDRIYIESPQDMLKLILHLEEEPVEELRIYSKKYKGNELYKLYGDTLKSIDPSYIPKTRLFYSYSTQASGKTLTIKEVSLRNDKSVFEHYKMYKKLIADLAENSKAETEEESLVKLYTLLYNNMEYTNKDWRAMNAGNFLYGETSCTGFSLILSDSLTALGIENSIEYTDSHYWVTAGINGEKTIIDIATDLYTKTPFSTLGVSTMRHKELTASLPYSVSWYEDLLPANTKLKTSLGM